jgi:hypothetical protein
MPQSKSNNKINKVMAAKSTKSKPAMKTSKPQAAAKKKVVAKKSPAGKKK